MEIFSCTLQSWLADVVNDIAWDDWDKKDGARHLVEEVAYRLGTHGLQILANEDEVYFGETRQ